MRRLRRFTLPVGLVVLAVALGVLLFGVAGGGTSTPSSSTPAVTLTASSTSTGANLVDGAQLFAITCSTCHGARAEGSAIAPNLQGLGSATVDLWVGTGLMPLTEPGVQPVRKPVKFTDQQVLDIASWVQSLTPGQGVAIPTVDLKGADVAKGFDLFALNCAPCHTITGAGDALALGTEALPLHGVTATQVTEAIQTGPGNMPRFSPGALSPAEAKDVVAYVTEYVEKPTNTGGIGLGGVGPVAEGFIGLFIGVGACMLIALWIGDRTEREEPHDDHGEPEGAHA